VFVQISERCARRVAVRRTYRGEAAGSERSVAMQDAGDIRREGRFTRTR